jgi:repressor of nif and glnA expression
MARPVRFLNHVIEDFTMQVTFDPVAGTGTVVHNLSLIKNEDLEFAVRILKDASRSGVSVSGLVKFHPAGE